MLDKGLYTNKKMLFAQRGCKLLRAQFKQQLLEAGRLSYKKHLHVHLS
jgi:hypothetical protein